MEISYYDHSSIWMDIYHDIPDGMLWWKYRITVIRIIWYRSTAPLEPLNNLNLFVI